MFEARTRTRTSARRNARFESRLLSRARCATGGAAFSLPPENPFEVFPARIGAGDPFVQQIELFGEPAPLFMARCAERRAVLVRDEIVHRQVLAAGFEPAQDGFDVGVAFGRIDGAEQRMLEE